MSQLNLMQHALNKRSRVRCKIVHILKLRVYVRILASGEEKSDIEDPSTSSQRKIQNRPQQELFQLGTYYTWSLGSQNLPISKEWRIRSCCEVFTKYRI